MTKFDSYFIYFTNARQNANYWNVYFFSRYQTSLKSRFGPTRNRLQVGPSCPWEVYCVLFRSSHLDRASCAHDLDRPGRGAFRPLCVFPPGEEKQNVFSFWWIYISLRLKYQFFEIWEAKYAPLFLGYIVFEWRFFGLINGIYKLGSAFFTRFR